VGVAANIERIRRFYASGSANRDEERENGRRQTDAAMTDRFTVLYDGDCGVCTQTARVLARLDSRRRLQLVSLQEATLPGMPPSDELMDALHAVDTDGNWFVGAAAAVELARHVALLWPISVIAKLPLAMPILNVLYRAISDNRQGLSRLLRLDVCQVRSRQA
jgi:predicted DCC family thiol-disulfide oxidoreductase YuxK